MSQVPAEERSMLEELIENYQSSRCLWDIQCDSYSNRDRRNAAFNSLLEIYKKVYPDATIATLKKKLENMRSAFKREEKKVSYIFIT